MGCGPKKRYDSNFLKKTATKNKRPQNLYKQPYANEMDNLEEMYKFLER